GGVPMFPSRRLLTFGVPLAALVLLGLAPAAYAAVAFDAARRPPTTTTGRTSRSWSHTIGGGTDRLLMVGVAIEDVSTTDANITSVTYNGTALTAGPNSKRSGGGTGIIQPQLFYLLNAGLGAAGAKTVVVNTQGPVDGISAGAVALAPAAPAGPPA